MAIIGRISDEFKNLNSNSFLRCVGCGDVIWGGWYVTGQYFSYDDVTSHYNDHVSACMKLRRLIIKSRLTPPPIEVPFIPDPLPLPEPKPEPKIPEGFTSKGLFE